jgi:Sec-independent protein translocase protein TatA
MSDILVVLVILLIGVLIWRGPKTLPKLGQALGRGVREARTEIEKPLDDRPDDDRRDHDRPA